MLVLGNQENPLVSIAGLLRETVQVFTRMRPWEG